MNSCLYVGQVKHLRLKPARHGFDYRIFMMYLDLDELPSLFDRYWLWSARNPALARFRRRDHVGPASSSLKETICDLVEEKCGSRPAGPIRLLTNLAYFGYCFNPVSFYYCFAEDGETIETIVAEVNNTPWGERECYVLDCSESRDAALRFEPEKHMHVSPFMPMDVDYRWTMTVPNENLAVHMGIRKDGNPIFNASMLLQRRNIGSGSLARTLLQFPFMTAKITLAIYWQALRLWLKRCPFYVHPGRGKGATQF